MIRRTVFGLGILLLCAGLATAQFQSRDSNYNKNVTAGGTTTTTFDPANTNANLTLSNGNLTATTNSNVGGYGVSRSIASHSTGKYYAEFVHNLAGSNGNSVNGSINGSGSLSAYLGNTNSVGYFGNAAVYVNNVQVSTIQAYTNLNNVGMAFDITNSLIWFRVNGGNWNNSAPADPATGVGGISTSGYSCPCYAGAAQAISTSETFTANFGASAYTFTAPAGFGNW